MEPTVPLTRGTEIVETRGKVKSLGAALDTKLSFWPCTKNLPGTAIFVVQALKRLIENTFRPRQSKHTLLLSRTNSILLNRAEI